MRENNKRYSDYEVTDSGFMAEKIHWDKTSNRTADKTKTKKSHYSYTPFFFNGSCFVDTENHKCDYIYDTQVIYEPHMLRKEFQEIQIHRSGPCIYKNKESQKLYNENTDY